MGDAAKNSEMGYNSLFRKSMVRAKKLSNRLLLARKMAFGINSPNRRMNSEAAMVSTKSLMALAQLRTICVLSKKPIPERKKSFARREAEDDEEDLKTR